VLSSERLNTLLTYDFETGAVHRRASKKPLIPDFDGLCSIYDSIDKKTIKVKLNKVLFKMLLNQDVGPNQRVLHRNMQEDDFRLKNLMLVHKDKYIEIKEAYRNIEYAIKMLPHPTDRFSYFVQWYEKGVLKNKLVQDAIPAKKLVLRLKLKYSKILTRYCVFDD
jgi:hypothetical protein